MWQSARADAATQHPDCAWVGTEQKGADWCRRHGWLVQTMLAVNPHGVVKRTYLEPCTYEDGSGGPLPCAWNFPGMKTGNGRGLAYWITRHRVIHYVWKGTPTPISEGYAHWPTWHERHRWGLDKKCWLYHNRQGGITYQCPEDQAPSI